MIAILIVVVNKIIQLICVAIVKSIGLETKSKEMSVLQITIFVSQYINTAFVLTLSYASWDNGKTGYTDYSNEWYQEVGLIYITTMIIQSVMPFVMLVSNFAIVTLKRFIDSKSLKLKNVSKTKSKTIQ